MKKKLVFLFPALLLFACSSEAPSPMDPTNDTNERIVDFSVSTFEQTTLPLLNRNVEKSILATIKGPDKVFITYAAYNKTNGNFVKHKDYMLPYSAKPQAMIKDTLSPGQYTICIGLQYMQEATPLAQPNIIKNYSDAEFNYSPSNAYFFKTYDIDLTTNSATNEAILPRITGAAEIFIRDILTLTNTDENVIIGAYNIPQAFKIKTETAVTPTNPLTASYEATIPLIYFSTVRGNSFQEDYPNEPVYPFPAAFTGGFTNTGGVASSVFPQTYYKYIHTMPTNSMYFEIKAGTATKKVTGFSVETNTLTRLSGEFNVLKENNTNVSINDTWNPVVIQQY